MSSSCFSSSEKEKRLIQFSGKHKSMYTVGYTRFSMSSKRKSSIVNSSHSIIIAVFLVLATSISVIGIVSNHQPQITLAQQQQQQTSQVVNQTSSVLKQQPNLQGVSFDIGNNRF
jgi:cytoskeletal protein RodZ